MEEGHRDADRKALERVFKSPFFSVGEELTVVGTAAAAAAEVMGGGGGHEWLSSVSREEPWSWA